MAIRNLQRIEVGFDVFLADGAASFGAVRNVRDDRLIVNVENAGDLAIPLEAVVKVAADKVILDWNQLPPRVQEAIRHTTDVEDFPPRDEGEVELVGALPLE